MTDAYILYPLPLRLLHWFVALLIIFNLGLGLSMESFSGEPRAAAYGLHKSIGVSVLMLVALRLALRLRLGVPDLPSIAPWQRRLAHLVHALLYACMILLPVSGYVMSTAAGKGVAWFGFTLPVLMGLDKALAHTAAQIHGWLAWSLMALIVLHVAGALVHQYRDRMKFIQRMGWQ